MKVLKITNQKVRTLLNQFTIQYTNPDRIEFTQDGAGNWITSVENFGNFRYVGIRQDFKKFLQANGINTNIMSLKEALQTYGEIIDYIPVPPEL